MAYEKARGRREDLFVGLSPMVGWSELIVNHIVFVKGEDLHYTPLKAHNYPIEFKCLHVLFMNDRDT